MRWRLSVCVVCVCVGVCVCVCVVVVCRYIGFCEVHMCIPLSLHAAGFLLLLEVKIPNTVVCGVCDTQPLKIS